jgi:hypothetical protein
MATVNSDFVEVQLSAAGIQAAGVDGALRITAAHMSYEFTPGARVRVLTSEWAKVLSRETLRGNTILELAPASAPVPDTARASAEAQLKTLQAEEAALESQIVQEGN